MSSQKIHIIPEVKNLVSSAPQPLVFWKKINQNQDRELHLFMLLEARTDSETQNLGKSLWEMVSTYLNELVLNQSGLLNPEQACEAIIKSVNGFLLNWSQKVQINDWGEISLIIAVSSPTAIYFARIGKCRLLLVRDDQVVVADENLSHHRSPQLSPPFAELAGGPLRTGDRLMLLSQEIIESFSWEEISSLATPVGINQVFYNIIRSIEILPIPQNAAFLLGDVVSITQQNDNALPLIREKLKESRIGDLRFIEFNPIAEPSREATSSFVPWKEILKAAGGIIAAIYRLITKPFAPIGKQLNSLSRTRKIILLSSLGLFVVFVIFLSKSFLEKPAVPAGPEKDYKAIYDQAVKLREEASSALIYQDEEKARRSLAQADDLLQQASQSSEWGIKAIKLRQDLSDQLATLDKAQVAQTSQIWSAQDVQATIQKLSFENNGDIACLTDKGIWSIKPSATENQATKNLSWDLGQSQNKKWLVSVGNENLYLFLQDGFFYVIGQGNKSVSDKKNLPEEAKDSSVAVATYGSSLYFFNQKESQIKQFSYGNGNLTFKNDWLKQNVAGDFKDDTVASMSIDGNVYLVTSKGNLYRFSGGKKSSWDVEKPGSAFQGDNLVLNTKSEYKNLYLLDPAKKRIVFFDKETGKLLGQMTNSNLAQAIDFQIDEKNKTAYFATGENLFKMSFGQ